MILELNSVYEAVSNPSQVVLDAMKLVIAAMGLFIVRYCWGAGKAATSWTFNKLVVSPFQWMFPKKKVEELPVLQETKFDVTFNNMIESIYDKFATWNESMLTLSGAGMMIEVTPEKNLKTVLLGDECKNVLVDMTKEETEFFTESVRKRIGEIVERDRLRRREIADHARQTAIVIAGGSNPSSKAMKETFDYKPTFPIVKNTR